MAPPNFGDIGKACNDLFSKDFPTAVKLEVKTRAPNGVQFTVRGSEDPKIGAIAGEIEGKYTDLATGITFTESWTSANALKGKLELEQNFPKGLKAEITGELNPATSARNAKFGLIYAQPTFHARTFVDVLKGPVVTGDAVLGHEGFLVGAEASYDIGLGAIKRYQATVGYAAPEYIVSVNGNNNMSTFTASYYHRVSALVEAGGKATYDAKSPSKDVALEIATKYILDPTAYVKAKINNGGIAAVSYNQILRPGIKVGIGATIDTQHFNESAHKIGFSFEASS